jgi:RNA polymerase sigma-70 factor, ECF subfamily
LRSLTGRASAWLVRTDTRTAEPDAIEAEVTGLFHEFRSPLLRYAVSLGVSVSDGEDVVQEVFLALHRHLTQRKPRTNLRGWIFRTGHNLALKRRTGIASRPSIAPEDTELIETAPDPEQRAASRQNHERINAVVAALPERDRCCLYLKMEGLRYREIAETLEMSLGAVANSLSLTLSKLAVVTGRNR